MSARPPALDPADPIVMLCQTGIAAETAGRFDDARLDY